MPSKLKLKSSPLYVPLWPNDNVALLYRYSVTDPAQLGSGKENASVNVFCTVAWFIPSLALNVNVADPSNPSAVAESSVLGVIVTTDEFK